MIDRKLGIFLNKISPTDCKRSSSLNTLWCHQPPSTWSSILVDVFERICVLGSFGLEIDRPEVRNFLGNKIGLSGCKWSSLNTPGTQTCVSYHLLIFCLLLSIFGCRPSSTCKLASLEQQAVRRVDCLSVRFANLNREKVDISGTFLYI